MSEEQLKPRLRPLGRAETTDKLVHFIYNRKFGKQGDPAVAASPTPSGSPGNYEAIFAHSPDILEHILQGFYIKQTKKRKLPLPYMELAITRIGWAAGCRWMFSEHSKLLRGLGFSEAQLAAIPSWGISALFDEKQRAVLAFADAMVQDHGRTPDAVFDALTSFLNEEQVIELVYIAGMFLMNAHMIRALRLEWDNAPEPVREMPSPDSYQPGQFMDLEPKPLPSRT